ncbi:hypothetical protein [Dactylosporangium sp. NPDC049140]|uniref:hypothetical protein n=1 Tax=Dactylosporangium sp. NPDC049140 TaxID=3155647 RepID=UPI0033C2AD6C
MVVYALTEPVDDSDALTPLPDWITADPVPRTQWALQAALALVDVADHVRWDGEMRHLPSVGAVLAPPESHPYLVVKQDNNGTTFVISDIEIAGVAGVVEYAAHAIRRPIGGWTHPTSHDIPALPLPGTTVVVTRPDAAPPF